MCAVAVKEFIKRSTLLVNSVIFGDGVRSNRDILQYLTPFYPNSIGSLKARSAIALQAAQQTFPLFISLMSATCVPPASPKPIVGIFPGADQDAAAEQLADLFNKYGSDKSSTHNYHLLYGPMMAPLRTATARLLEIGLGTNNPDIVSTMGKEGRPGASLRAFRDFLPNAKIFGADIDRGILFSETRIQTYYVDQTEQSTFDVLSAQLGNEPFDFVIDDGLHSPNANIATMLFALKILKQSGIFVVEDIPARSIPIWQTVIALLPEAYHPVLIQSKSALLFMLVKA
jgi:hypothetical protein